MFICSLHLSPVITYLKLLIVFLFILDRPGVVCKVFLTNVLSSVCVHTLSFIKIHEDIERSCWCQIYFTAFYSEVINRVVTVCLLFNCYSSAGLHATALSKSLSLFFSISLCFGCLLTGFVLLSQCSGYSLFFSLSLRSCQGFLTG